MEWVTGKSAGGDDDVLIVAALNNCNGILLVLRMLKILEDAEGPTQEEYRRYMEQR